ncbi:MAG: zinc ribbon domain-containing protein [Anaerolineales bacterium]|jgi:putative FmdB family regulatory protein
MPTYEYRCQECGKRVNIYQSYEEYGQVPVSCPHCGSDQLRRLISRVRVARSEGERLDSLTDPDRWGDLDQEDPRAVGRMMRQMSREMGEDMPPEFDEVVDRLESGEDPDEIEKSLPDIGDEL